MSFFTAIYGASEKPNTGFDAIPRQHQLAADVKHYSQLLDMHKIRAAEIKLRGDRPSPLDLGMCSLIWLDDHDLILPVFLSASSNSLRWFDSYEYALFFFYLTFIYSLRNYNVVFIYWRVEWSCLRVYFPCFFVVDLSSSGRRSHLNESFHIAFGTKVGKPPTAGIGRKSTSSGLPSHRDSMRASAGGAVRDSYNTNGN